MLNKSVLFEDVYSVIKLTLTGQKTTSFNYYSNWMKKFKFGKEAIDLSYKRPEKTVVDTPFSTEDLSKLKENISSNVIETANKYPDTDFYIFLSPYSIYYWDKLNQTGELKRQIEAEKEVIEMLVNVENIHVFSFNNNFDLICNTDHYTDQYHYDESINSQILNWISERKYEITKSNYLDYINSIDDFYTNYDYESLFVNPAK